MKYLAATILILVSACGAGPLVTEGELQETIASVDARSDAGDQWVLDAVTGFLRGLFPDQVIPPITLEVQPGTVVAAHEDGIDWGALELLLASVLGTGGAVVLRSIDHYRKEKARVKAENVV